MRTTITAFLAVFLVPGVASAKDLMGRWVLPSGQQATVSKTATGARVVTTVKVQRRTVRLVLKGTMEDVRVGGQGGLGITATARSFWLRHQGRRCMVKAPQLAVIGDLVPVAGKGLRYKATGWVKGHIYCGGENTWALWSANVSGEWLPAPTKRPHG